MGVINITPNSFSDGDLYTTVDSVKERINFLYDTTDIFDFGAESTAPFNPKISLEEELCRFEELLIRPFNELRLENKEITIDTYKPEVIDYLLRELPVEFIWNDVSGVVDDETLRLLHDNHLSYILSHTNVPIKESTNDHMNFLYEGDMESFYQGLKTKLNKNLAILKDINVIVDVCFGFSKTREQNLWLLDNFSRVVKDFNHHELLLGISKKSFLREPAGAKLSDPGIAKQVERKQEQYFKKIFNESLDSSFIVRLHDTNCNF